MSDNIIIRSKAIPANPRSKNYPVGAVVSPSSGGGNSTVVTGGGSNVDILKVDDLRSATDKNVFSSLRTLAEILSRIVATGDDTELTDKNYFSSLRTSQEISTAIENVLNRAKAMFLSSVESDEAAGIITFLNGLKSEEIALFLKGLDVAGGISTDTLTATTITSQILNVLNKITAKDADFSGDVTVLEKDVTVSKGNIKVSKGNVTVAGKTTTLNLLVQALAETYDLNVSHVATLMGTIVKDYVSSESFISGFAGEGMKIYKALNGDWNMEIDNLTVRKIFSVFELVVQKIIHQGGMVIRSAAGGKLTKVTDGGTYWKCEHDSTDDFLQNDQIICQDFTGTKIKRYWRLVTSAGAGYFNLSKTDCEAGSATPEIGDDVAVLGNRTNTARQKAQIDCAIGDTGPYRDDYDGINSYSLVGKLITRTGNLSGITDSVFGVLSGSGLYATNVYLKGMFILRSGKSVESELNTANAAALAAQSTAENAQSTANTAKTSAQTANSLLTDIASDSKLTPTEKQQTKKEWDIIVSEKPLNNTSAVKFGVATTSYDAAYNTLNTYITPLLASLTATSDIVGATFRSTFKSYYDARTNLFNAISAKAKELADTAQTTVDNLQIGGRNLLVGSSNGKGWTHYESGNTFKLTRASAVEGYIYSNLFELEGEQDYTLSLEYKNDGKIKSIDLYLLSNKFQSNNAIIAKSLPISTEWAFFVCTFKTTSNFTGVSDISLRIDHNGTLDSSSASIWAKNIKLEKGNKATDWTPAPEDIENRITTVETKFEVREDQISSKVSEATTAATNAKKSETSASGSASTASSSATTAGLKASEASGSATSAAGSATTASTKAGEASTSAGNAKKSADDAAAKLVTITEKESSINQTASGITLQVKEVTTKTTEATTAASNASKSATAASTSATSASGSAGTASTKAGEAATSATTATTKANAASSSATAAATSATNAKTSADASAVVLQTVSTKQSEINAKADQITLKVTEVTEKTVQATNAAELATAMSKGRMLYRDPTFEKGFNGTSPYCLVTSRAIEAIAGCPNRLAKGMRITATGWTSATDLRAGGFAFGTQSRANAIFIVRIIALIPTGRSIENYHNPYGAGQAQKWLTSRAGTGKWEEYVCKVMCGSSGSFGTVNYLALVGGTAPTAASPLIWYVAYATVFDVTDAEIDYISDAADKYTTKTTYEAGIKVLSDSITSKVAQSDFNSLGNRVNNAESTITQHTTQIASKVAQTTFDLLGNRVSTAESTILQQSGLIEQRVTKTDYNKTGRLLALGSNADTVGTAYVMLNETQLNNAGRGFTLYKILKSSLAFTRVGVYDVYAGGANLTNFINALNAISVDYIVAVISSDAITIDTAMATVLANYGGSDMTCTSTRRSYVLIGQKGIGKGNGLEQWKQSTAGGVAISATIINGIVTGFWGGGNLVSKIESAETRITQTENSIALKANQTTVDGINRRLTSAEIAIDPAQINLTVKTQTETIAANAVKDRPTTETIKSQITLDGFGISVFGKKIDFTGKVTFSSMDSATQSTINGKATPAQIATAKNEAISAASTDATTKANNAKSDAISNAATDATTKANNAKSAAITAAATDAQTKANSALSAAKTYTDTLKNSLGALAYETLVTKAKLDSTIIEGGFIKTSLIDVDTLIAKNLAATKGTIGGFKITANSVGASSNGDKLILAPDGLILESTQQYVAIGKAVPGSTGADDLVAAYFSTKVPTGTGPMNGAGTVMINTSGGLTQTGLSIRTGNRSSDFAIDLTGRIKVNGVIGKDFTVSIAHCWYNGSTKTCVLEFKDGILFSSYYQ